MTGKPGAAGSTPVRVGPGYTLGRFRCPPDDPRWQDENWIGDDDHVVFPGPAVRIDRGRSSFVATPYEVMLYNRDEVYRRALVAPAGDNCVFVAVTPGLSAEITDAVGSRANRPFPVQHLRCEQSDYLLTRLLARRAAGMDPLAIDEAVFELLSRVVRNAQQRRTERVATRRAVIEEVKAILATHVDGAPSMASVAAGVNYSPYHLARLFREQMGTSMYAYWQGLRLRLALPYLLESDRSVADIASELGFANHSHFTYGFRRAFGVTPRELRVAAAS